MPTGKKTGVIVDASSKFLAARADQVIKQGEKLRINILKDTRARQADDKREEAKAVKRMAFKKTLAAEAKITLPISISKEDPMFTVMSETFDAGCVQGLLLNTLRAQDQGELVFCSDQALSQFIPNHCTQRESLDASSALSKFKRPKKGAKRICPYISSMKGWIQKCKDDAGVKEEDEEMFDREEDSSADEDFGAPNFIPEHEPEEQFDDFSGPPPEVDDLVGELENNGMLNLPLEDAGAPPCSQQPSPRDSPGSVPDMIQDPPDFREEKSNAQNINQKADFSDLNDFYSSHYRNNAWGSAEQWKKARRVERLRAARIARLREGSSAPPQKSNASEDGSPNKRRKKRKENWIDFKKELTAVEERKFNSQTWKKNRNQLREEDRKKQRECKYELPKDYKLEQDLFFTPFLVPKRFKQNEEQDESSGIPNPVEFDAEGRFLAGDVEHDAENAFNDFGPAFDVSDDDHPPRQDEEEDDDVIEIQQNHEIEDKIIVPFEAIPSTVNIKALKDTLYSILQECLTQSSENEVEFGKIVNRLNYKLKAKTLRRLTPHLVFITLLYLCNEKGLLLSQTLPELHSKDPVPVFTIKEVGLGALDAEH